MERAVGGYAAGGGRGPERSGGRRASHGVHAAVRRGPRGPRGVAVTRAAGRAWRDWLWPRVRLTLRLRTHARACPRQDRTGRCGGAGPVHGPARAGVEADDALRRRTATRGPGLLGWRADEAPGSPARGS